MSVTVDLKIHIIEDRFALILRDKCPCAGLAVKGTAETIISAIMDQICQLISLCDLRTDLFFVLLRELLRIQFISEGSGHSHNSSCPERSHSSVLLIRTH